jgi:nucleotide-binding universal stress UspA family protein
MEIKKILWPTDFSNNSEIALPYVMSLGETYHTEVHVLYVIPELGIHESWYGNFDMSHIEKIHAWENQKAKARLNEICDKYLQGCRLFIKHISIGDPAKEILKFIETINVDMVVMASRGMKGRFHFGSVAEKVVKSTSVPVVVIPIRKNDK